MIIRYVTMGLPKGPHRGVVCDWSAAEHAKTFLNDATLPATACIWCVPGTLED